MQKKKTYEQEVFAKNINELVELAHNASLNAGWWQEMDRFNPHTIPTKIALTHGELSEALEGYRKDEMDEHLPHRPAIEVELADAIHRIFDIAGWLGLDLGGAFVEKVAYNKTRLDHQTSARSAAHGKRF